MTRHAIKVVRLICKISQIKKKKRLKFSEYTYNFVWSLLSKKTCCKYEKVANLLILYQGSKIKLSVRESKTKGFVV